MGEYWRAWEGSGARGRCHAAAHVWAIAGLVYLNARVRVQRRDRLPERRGAIEVTDRALDPCEHNRQRLRR